MQGAPRLDPDMVRDFVNNSHSNIDRVHQLLTQEKAIVNAAWDWGSGDWETGLGAAAHMGRRDIALLLVDHGARMDIFAAAMLGHLEVVRAMIAACPQAATSPGPHGIPLLRHAEAGGAEAVPVVEFLRSLSG